MATEQHKVLLPSLIHRIGRLEVNNLKLIANDYGCEVKRIRRSRNWQVEGSYEALQRLYRALESIPFQFVSNKLRLALTKIEPPLTLEQQLAALLANNPNITLSELVVETGCELAQARQARFCFEFAE